MRTDEHFLTIFKEHPEWLFQLAGETAPGDCRMVSESQKAVINLQLSSDSVIRPVETGKTIHAVEQVDKLDQLALDFLDFKSINDLENWLK